MARDLQGVATARCEGMGTDESTRGNWAVSTKAAGYRCFASPAFACGCYSKNDQETVVATKC